MVIIKDSKGLSIPKFFITGACKMDENHPKPQSLIGNLELFIKHLETIDIEVSLFRF
jgi:hypothetical protein